MEAIFGLSTAAQLILGPVIAFAVLAFFFGVVPAIMDKKKKKQATEGDDDTK